MNSILIGCILLGAAGQYGGIMGPDGTLTPLAERYRALAAMVEANEDVIHPGVPGPGAVALGSSAPGAKISALHRADGAAVGILHFPDGAFRDKPDENPAKTDVPVQAKAAKPGAYVLRILAETKTLKLAAGETAEWVIPAVSQNEAVFLKVKTAHPAGKKQ